MAYQVIARKYRPQRFSDVVGQEHVTQTLANAIARNRIAHAYLFCGPRGTGKTTIARIFAKCLNCTGGPKVDFSDDDPRCLEIAEGRSLDVLEIDAASNRGIEEIRGLRETVRYAPATSKFKIYIIDEVHMLTKEAFNALLKTLEEPPAHVKFMFATTEPEKVLATILSRCQRFDLRRIPAALIVKHLAQIAKQEKVKIQEPALYAIARGAEGGMRDAESTLDQLISFCGDAVEESDVLSMFGLTAQGQLHSLAGAILDGHVEKALRELNELASHGKDLARLLSDLLNHFRNILIHQVSKGDSNLLELTEAEAASLASQSGTVSSEGLTRILEVFGDAEMRLRDAASKKILLEVAVLKAIEARNAVNIDTVLRKLQQFRDGSATGGAAETTQGTPAKPGVSTRPKALATGVTREPDVLLETGPSQPAPRVGSIPAGERAEADSPSLTVPTGLQDLNTVWEQLVERVGRSSPFTRTYLLEAHPVSINKGVFTIGFPPQNEEHIGLVDNTRNQKLLQEKMAELGQPGLAFKFIKSQAPPRRHPDDNPAGATQPQAPSNAASPKPSPVASARSAPPAATAAAAKPNPAPAPFDKEAFKNDPLIQRALEVFKGQIVQVQPRQNTI